MESEKVKEIKKALEQQGNCGIVYAVNNDKKNPCKFINYADILTLINELESENERLSKELDSEWKDRRKAEEDLHKAQWNYKIGLAQSRKRNQQLKDRIAELENIIKNNLQYSKGYGDGVKATVEVAYPKKLNEFTEKVAKRLINIKGIKEILDETLNEFLGEDK